MHKQTENLQLSQAGRARRDHMLGELQNMVREKQRARTRRRVGAGAMLLTTVAAASVFGMTASPIAKQPATETQTSATLCTRIEPHDLPRIFDESPVVRKLDWNRPSTIQVERIARAAE